MGFNFFYFSTNWRITFCCFFIFYFLFFIFYFLFFIFYFLFFIFYFLFFIFYFLFFIFSGRGAAACVGPRSVAYMEAICEHAVIEGRKVLRFRSAQPRFGSNPKTGGLRLSHRAGSVFLRRVHSNTAPAFAARPCASLARAWKSTCAFPSCTPCSPGGLVSAMCMAFFWFYVMCYDIGREISWKQF